MKISFDLFKTIALVVCIYALFRLWGSNEFWVLLVLYLNTWELKFTFNR